LLREKYPRRKKRCQPLRMRFENASGRLKPGSSRFKLLYFADGGTRQICARGDFLLKLLADTCRGADLSPRQTQALELVRRSIAARGPDGARMIEVLHCLLRGPALGQDHHPH
jgi:hypothetical protein